MKTLKLSMLLSLLPALAFAQSGNSESQQAMQADAISRTAVMAAFERAKECRLKSLFVRQMMTAKERGHDVDFALSFAEGSRELTALVNQIYQPNHDNADMENEVYSECVEDRKRALLEG